jgi:D-serine deaminase-like pyridoxal phosphate-dependent protein
MVSRSALAECVLVVVAFVLSRLGRKRVVGASGNKAITFDWEVLPRK